MREGFFCIQLHFNHLINVVLQKDLTFCFVTQVRYVVDLPSSVYTYFLPNSEHFPRLNPPQLRRPASPGGLGICLRLGSGGGTSPSESLPSRLVNGDPARLSAHESYKGTGLLGLDLGSGERRATLSYGNRTARRFLRILRVRFGPKSDIRMRYTFILPNLSGQVCSKGNAGRRWRSIEFELCPSGEKGEM